MRTREQKKIRWAELLDYLVFWTVTAAGFPEAVSAGAVEFWVLFFVLSDVLCNGVVSNDSHSSLSLMMRTLAPAFMAFRTMSRVPLEW